MTKQRLLYTENLSIGYKEKKLVENLNLEIFSGEFIGLKGLNGSGKTTLLRTLMGALSPVSGMVMMGDVNIHRVSEKDRAQHIAIVLTDRIRLNGMSVTELVELGRYPISGAMHFGSSANDEFVSNSLEKMRIKHLADKSLNEISDGELQKTMIARALAQQTPLILMDEPTAFLDYIARDEFYVMMSELVRQTGVSILFSSHDLDAMEKYATRIITIG